MPIMISTFDERNDPAANRHDSDGTPRYEPLNREAGVTSLEVHHRPENSALHYTFFKRFHSAI